MFKTVYMGVKTDNGKENGNYHGNRGNIGLIVVNRFGDGASASGQALF